MPVNRAGSIVGNFPLAPGVILVVMSRERTAVVALAVLFGLAAVPALLLRGSAQPVSRHGIVTAAPVAVPAYFNPPPGPCLDGSIPIFPGATPTGQAALDRSVVNAINALGLAPRLRAGVMLRAPVGTWTAGMQHGKDLLSFYARRMRPVDFWDMTRRLRRLIGVRPGGTVDSPPLLYASSDGAVLLRPHPDGTLDLVLLCPPASS
jgi:hypothetical protein